MIKVEGKCVTKIDRDATSALISSGMKCIGQFACFNGSLISLNLDTLNIQIIEKFSFSHCFSLQSASFPSCLEKMCEGSFQYCKSLKDITFGKNPQLREIGDNAFRYCKSLEHFEFPALLEFIGGSSFDGCIMMKTFDLRNTNIRKVGNFVGCREDAAIFLPEMVSSSLVKNVTLSEGGHPGIKLDECGYMYCNRNICQGAKNKRHVFIRRGFETIANFCFIKSNLVSVTIPDSIITISSNAFDGCFISKVTKDFVMSLKQVIFPKDSQLEEIYSAFSGTCIKQLSLPPSVKEIGNVCYGMNHLESIYVNNDLYRSNQEGTAIYSKDGFELVCVINTIKHLEIPDCIRIIRESAFYNSQISGRLIIPSSVEIIEDQAFMFSENLKIIEFSSGSRLKSLGYDSLYKLDDLIINNENFIKREDGVVISLNPAGILFVPKELTELEVDFNVEVIYANAFYGSKIQSLNLPKSLKKIKYSAFEKSDLRNITFEKGTELIYIQEYAFKDSKIENIKLPLVTTYLGFYFISCGVKSIELPPNFKIFCTDSIAFSCCRNLEKVICPASSLQVLTNIDFNWKLKILEDQ